MRCLSPNTRYSIKAFGGKEQVVVDARGYAQSLTLEKSVRCDFEHGGLLDHEIDAALEHFTFAGLPEGVNPLTRISTFDTEAFCQQYPANQRDEMQVQLDQRLRELQADFPNDFIIVDMPSHEKPWERYDETELEDIVKIVQATGFKATAEKVRLYELENLNRSEVIEAMMQLENPELYDDDDEVVPSGGDEAILVES